MKKLIFCFIFITAVLSVPAQNGKIINDEIHAVTLEENLIGDSSKRSILVYLPPDYEKQTEKRYPSVYLLHDFTPAANKTWIIENEGLRMNIRTMMDKLIAEQKVHPMILVMPDASNKFGGSFYTDSITTGNWEDFITRELVEFIDKKYRTIPNASSRGITGHSMGGYGAIKLAMKNPDVYGAIYATSPCCLDDYPNLNSPDAFMLEASKIKSWKDVENTGFFARTFLASAAAFSPNPAKPPFYADFPVKKKGESDASAENAQARWLANTPMWMVDQYRVNLIKFRSIAFDVGTKEELLKSIRGFSDKLKLNKIKHSFEEFEGDHIDKTAERIETRIMPFFSQTLEFSTKELNNKLK
ncbi:MAG: alpha/beta hydrolase-fold protein [Acidobacteriota bacterium]|nr:alpha/beta hydrolase-fold protein [Acidobacteriota bacterium]